MTAFPIKLEKPCFWLVWTKVFETHHYAGRAFVDLCHPVGYEVFSVGSVGIPEDPLKRKSPGRKKTFHVYGGFLKKEGE